MFYTVLGLLIVVSTSLVFLNFIVPFIIPTLMLLISVFFLSSLIKTMTPKKN